MKIKSAKISFAVFTIYFIKKGLTRLVQNLLFMVIMLLLSFGPLVIAALYTPWLLFTYIPASYLYYKVGTYEFKFNLYQI